MKKAWRWVGRGVALLVGLPLLLGLLWWLLNLRDAPAQPWPEALAVLTGQKQMDASAILDYFAPLQAWLKEQNKGQKCGW